MLQSSILAGLENLTLLLGKLVPILLFTWLIGAEAQGVFTLFLAVYGVGTAMALLGLDTANNYFAARARRSVQRAVLLGNNIALYIFLGPLLVVALLVMRDYTNLLDGFSDTSFFWLLLTLPIGSLNVLAGTILFGRNYFGIRLLGTLFQNVIFNLGVIVGALSGTLSIEDGLRWWTVGLSVSTTIWVAVILWDTGRLPVMHFRYLKRQMGYALRAYPYFAMNAANFRLDNFFIAGLLGLSALGIYSVAVSIMEVFLYLPKSIANATLTHQTKNPNRSAGAVLNPLTTILICLIPFALIAPPIGVFLFFSQEFSEAAYLTPFLLPGILAMTLAVVGSYSLFARAQTWAASKAAGYGLITTVAANFLLIPLFGLYGAATATTLAYLVFGFFVLRTIARVENGTIAELLQPDWTVITTLRRRLTA